MNKQYLDTIKARIAKSVTLLNPEINKGRIVPVVNDLVLGEGRVIELAVLFVDITGYTSWRLSSQQDQLDALKKLNLFMSELFRIANDYNGTVEKNTGDGLMAYFEGSGSTSAIDSCDKATDAALTMFYVTNNVINPILVDAGFEEIKFRIGIDFGRITISKVGSARLFSSIVAIGISANIACKMLKDASPGQVILGEDVYNRLANNKKQLCKLLKYETGFTVTRNGIPKPYPFYHLDAVWRHPV